MRFRPILVVVILFSLIVLPGLGSKSVSNTISSRGTIMSSTLTWLHTDGKYIKNEYNQTVFLRGAAFGDLASMNNWGGGEPKLESAISSFQSLSDGKANVIRLAITPLPKVLTGTVYYPWSATLVDSVNNLWDTIIHPEAFDEAVDLLVSKASQRNIYVIIEFHGGFRFADANPELEGKCGDIYYYPEQYEATLGADPTPWINWHLHFVNRYKDNPTVAGFELYNEPWAGTLGGGNETLGHERWQNMVTQACQAIEQANPNALIVVASGNYGKVASYWIQNPLPYNVVYSWDQYYRNWADYWKEPYASGDWERAYNMTKEMLDLYACGSAVKANLPVICSEFGWGADAKEPGWDRNMADWLSILNEWETHWYTWWWWIGTYGLAANDWTSLSPQGEVWAQYLGP